MRHLSTSKLAMDYKRLPNEPQGGLEQFILELEHDYYPWYDRASTFNKVMWMIGQGTAIVAGAASAVVASVLEPAELPTFKWLLVLLPLIAAFATSLLVQTRVREVLALRE